MSEDDDSNDDDDDDDDDEDDDDDNDNDNEVATSVNALTVGDLIEAMKTNTAAAPSQPSSVVNLCAPLWLSYSSQLIMIPNVFGLATF